MNNVIDQHELTKILLDLFRHKFATPSEVMAFLYLCTRANMQQYLIVNYRLMARDLGRSKAQTCRAYVRKLVRLGLVSVSKDHGKWAWVEINLPAKVIQPVTSYRKRIPPPADA